MQATTKSQEQKIIDEEIASKPVACKLTTEKINLKIRSSVEDIKNKVKSLLKFTTDFQPHESSEFLQIVKSINLKYFSLNKFNVKLADIKRLRLSNANALIEIDIFNVYYPILVNILHDVFEKDYSIEIGINIYSAIICLVDIFFNYTDASSDFGKEFCKNDKLIHLYYKIISEFKENCLNKSLSKNLANLLRICISTLYNTLLHDVCENYTKMKEMKFLDLIKDFMKCEEGKIKRGSLLFVAYIADETESKMFKSDLHSISYLIGLLKKSLNSRFSRSQGLSTEELSKGLEKLSKNDENKQLLVEMGILPILKIQIEKDDIENQELALATLWSLAFNEKNQILIKKEFKNQILEMKRKLDERCSTELGPRSAVSCDPVVQTFPVKLPIANQLTRDKQIPENEDNLESKKYINNVSYDIPSNEAQLNENSDESSKNNFKSKNLLDGLIWTLTNFEDEKEKKMETTNQEQTAKYHLMISYCWSNSDIAMKIYECLVQKGYKVWIDKHNMSEEENLMESMAQAIQNSFAVIICISQNYKNSDNCRAEAQYAKVIKKPVIPVMVQKKYRPDGWLGICIIGLQYCDFVGRYNFEEALNLLLKQIKRIKTGNEHQKVDEIDHIDPIHVTNQSKNNQDITKWTNEKCKNWFDEIGIKKIDWPKHYTGNELDFLRSISQVPGEVFYQVSKTELKITDLKDLRILFQNLQIL